MGDQEGQYRDMHGAQLMAPFADVVLILARVVNVLIIIAGLGLVVWMHMWSQQVIAAYPVKPDNDVTRGFVIGMAGGLGIAGLSVIALAGLARGRRWGGIVDVFQWAAIWWPFAVGLSQFTADAFSISTAVSVAGASWARWPLLSPESAYLRQSRNERPAVVW